MEEGTVMGEAQGWVGDLGGTVSWWGRGDKAPRTSREGGRMKPHSSSSRLGCEWSSRPCFLETKG